MNLPATDALVQCGLAFLTAWTLALFLTPLTIELARRYGITDAPDGRLKTHPQATPYLGGLAVGSAFVIAFSVWSSPSITDVRSLGILAGGFMMVVLGLYDDLIDLSPGVKFVGQALAAIVLFKAGIRTDLPIFLDEAGESSRLMNLVVTLVWVTAITNALNIIDVMDGLATGTAMIASVFLFAIAIFSGDDPVVPFMAAVLAGALLGFLRFNQRPARIFLGDTGSLFIGFMLGALTMLVSYSTHNGRLTLLTPVVLLAIPVFDTAFVAWHRARRGVPFFHGSPDHFVLRLVHARGWSVTRTVRTTYLVAVALGVVSLVIVFGPGWTVVPLLLGVAASAILASRSLSQMPPPEDA